jgi:hypothetical protein
MASVDYRDHPSQIYGYDASSAHAPCARRANQIAVAGRSRGLVAMPQNSKPSRLERVRLMPSFVLLLADVAAPALPEVRLTWPNSQT